MIYLCDQCNFTNNELFTECPKCFSDEVFSTPEKSLEQKDQWVNETAFDFKLAMFEICNPVFLEKM